MGKSIQHYKHSKTYANNFDKIFNKDKKEPEKKEEKPKEELEDNSKLTQQQKDLLRFKQKGLGIKE